MQTMQKADKLAHAAKIIALCLPPVVMSLIGLVALSRKTGGGQGSAASRIAAVRRVGRHDRAG